MDEFLKIKPIAHIKTDFTEKFGVPRQSGIVDSVKGLIVFEKEFRDGQAIRNLDEFSHIWLIWGFSENDNKWSHTVRPPKLGGNKRVGVFSSRSPFRPNPLGLSSVKIDCISFDKELGPVILVSGADMVNGTPIYDIKPYIPYSDCHSDASCGYSKDKDEAHIKVIFENNTENNISLEMRCTIADILKQDPHPSYKRDNSRVYNLCYGHYDIKFTHNGELISVCDIIKREDKEKQE